MKKLMLVLSVFVMSLALVACGSGGEKTDGGDKKETGGKSTETIVFKASHSVAPTHPYHLGLEKFAEIVNKKTDGKYKIDIFHSGSIGGERDSIEGMQLNTVQLAMSSTGPLGTFVEDFQILDLPYLFKDYENVESVLDGEVGQMLMDKLPDIGVVGLGFCHNGFRNITTSEAWGPVTSVDNLKGLKIRTMENDAHLKAFKAWGADPTPMAWSDVFMSLQSGVINAQENPVTIILSTKIYEAQKNLCLSAHVYSPAMIMMSKASYDSLSDEDKAIFQEAGKEACAYERELIKKEEAEQIEALKEKGMNVTEIDSAPLKEMVKDIYAEYRKKFGDEIFDKLEQ